MPTDNEKEVGESIIRYCEEHYLSSPNMFCSSVDFKEFWRKQVHPHAEALKVDRQRAADAYIWWAKTHHSVEYDPIKKEGIDHILADCEIHYKYGPDMFNSKTDFDEFLDKEVRLHAKWEWVDFQKAADAYIGWAKTYHSDKYNNLS